MKPEDYDAVGAIAPQQIDGAAALGKALAQLGRIHLRQTKAVVDDVLLPFVERALRAQGFGSVQIRRIRHEGKSTLIESGVTSLHSANGVSLQEEGLVDLRLGESGALTIESVRFTRSRLSINSSKPFKISSGAQTDLLKLFFANVGTFKRKSYEIGEVCYALDKGFYGSAQSYRTKIRKRYLDARCDLNKAIRFNIDTTEDLLLYEDKKLFINKSLLKM